MTTHEFNNQSSPSERREVLRNDTMFSRQQNIADDAGGRFAKLTPATITGATSSPQYPQLPASSPWASRFDENVEPPLGYAVDEMPASEFRAPNPTKWPLLPLMTLVIALVGSQSLMLPSSRLR